MRIVVAVLLALGVRHVAHADFEHVWTRVVSPWPEVGPIDLVALPSGSFGVLHGHSITVVAPDSSVEWSIALATANQYGFARGALATDPDGNLFALRGNRLTKVTSAGTLAWETDISPGATRFCSRTCYDLAHLATLLANFGGTLIPQDSGDVDGDSDVDLADLSALLAGFGECAPVSTTLSLKVDAVGRGYVVSSSAQGIHVTQVSLQDGSSQWSWSTPSFPDTGIPLVTGSCLEIANNDDLIVATTRPGLHVCVSRISPDGCLIWQTESLGFGSPNLIVDAGVNGIFVSGSARPLGVDSLVEKFDETGAPLWQTVFAENSNSPPLAMCPLDDGGCIASGVNATNPPYSWGVVLTQKLSEAGEVTWARIGGTISCAYRPFFGAVLPNQSLLITAGEGTCGDPFNWQLLAYDEEGGFVGAHVCPSVGLQFNYHVDTIVDSDGSIYVLYHDVNLPYGSGVGTTLMKLAP